MRSKPIPSQPELHNLLRYDGATGVLFWKERVPSTWNTRYGGKPAFTATMAGGYKVGRIAGKLYYAHRVIWVFVNGAEPTADIDHINGDRADNRISNLRAVSRSENQRNKVWARGAKSGACGVHWHVEAQKWMATIGLNGKQVHLGLFIEKTAAIAVRRSAELQHGFTTRHGAAI